MNKSFVEEHVIFGKTKYFCISKIDKTLSSYDIPKLETLIDHCGMTNIKNYPIGEYFIPILILRTLKKTRWSYDEIS